jgi:hypothetical protein
MWIPYPSVCLSETKYDDETVYQIFIPLGVGVWHMQFSATREFLENWQLVAYFIRGRK